MSPLPHPEKPLKILTIDGGGLQAISTLIILDKLLETIARNNGVPREKPRPCDVFDTIAGIGAGGWLALLLGRFHLDIPACLSEWFNLIQCIAPKTKAEELCMRVLHHCYFNPDSLVDQIDRLTKVYGTGEYLWTSGATGPRCKKVFVAALRTDGMGSHAEYNLFRSYECPQEAKVLEGPENPNRYKISRAFAVTGAAKYFTPTWKEHMANGGKMSFSDSKYPKPHKITELALNEMWGLYGDDVPISVIVNIGPGLPNSSDLKQIARRFSWGRQPETEKKSQTSPATSVSSLIDGRIDKKLRRLESKIESDIKTTLHEKYPKNTPPYYRLAPEKSPKGTVRNDVCAPTRAMEATLEYLKDYKVGVDIEQVSQMLPLAKYVAV